jgi:hypothetical protein
MPTVTGLSRNSFGDLEAKPDSEYYDGTIEEYVAATQGAGGAAEVEIDADPGCAVYGASGARLVRFHFEYDDGQPDLDIWEAWDSDPERFCDSCAEADILAPAKTTSVNADFSSYSLCEECAAEYDARRATA